MTSHYWANARLVNGRLIDDTYHTDLNPNLPYFNSVDEAESYLREHDIRATIVGEGNAVVIPKYPTNIMVKVRQRLGLVEYDTSRDAEINGMSRQTVFFNCLEWEGILGYGSTILMWIKDIYGVTLE